MGNRHSFGVDSQTSFRSVDLRQAPVVADLLVLALCVLCRFAGEPESSVSYIKTKGVQTKLIETELV